ncbi:hypothetical protein GYA25_03020 [Candidatus Woesearchaeota archaeon]|jgi:hypothetical protein|nr:hypothetical protein [Candidatus Woesearchaeota archaeon]
MIEGLEDDVKKEKVNLREEKPRKKHIDYAKFYERFKELGGDFKKTGVYKVFRSFRNYLYSNLGIGYKKYMKDYQ